MDVLTELDDIITVLELRVAEIEELLDRTDSYKILYTREDVEERTAEYNEAIEHLRAARELLEGK